VTSCAEAVTSLCRAQIHLHCRTPCVVYGVGDDDDDDDNDDDDDDNENHDNNDNNSDNDGYNDDDDDDDDNNNNGGVSVGDSNRQYYLESTDCRSAWDQEIRDR